MLENFLYALPESCLLIGILLIVINYLFITEGKKTCFKIAQICIFLSAFFSLVFYNKTIFEGYLQTDSQTVLTYAICSFLSLVWLFLSSKWFIKQDLASTRFCILSLLLMLFLFLMIKGQNILILFISMLGISFLQYLLLKKSSTSEDLYHIGKRYLIISFVLVSVLAFILYILYPNGWNYQNVVEFLAVKPLVNSAFVVVSLFCCMCFLMAAAPFHFWYEDAVSSTDLPIAAYFSFVPIMAIWKVFLNLHEQILTPFAANLRPILIAFGCLSIIIGAIGSNATRFIRKIFAFSYLYYAGSALLILASFRTQSIPAVYIFMQTYLFLILGIYICLFGIRINGGYVNNLGFLGGLSSARPYISAAFLLCMLSLTGLPPFAGFLMQFTILFSVHKIVWPLYIILFGFLMMLPAYLRIIQTVYFMKKEYHFDRVDFSLYILLIIYACLLLALMLYPKLLTTQTHLLSGAL